MNQEKKVILITGSSGGIGSAIARKFSQEGYNVIINYLKSEKAAFKLQDWINKIKPRSALALKADVGKRIEVKQMFDQAYQEFSRIDILVNCAGINRDQPFLEMTDENWLDVVSTILTGTFICSQEYALRYQGNEGHIINIGALTAIRGRKNGANYCSARAGVLNLTKCLALELAPKIRVNCVTPGWINTDEVMDRYQLRNLDNLDRALGTIPMMRLGTPEDVSRMIYFIVNDSSYITGQNFLVDGGLLMY